MDDDLDTCLDFTAFGFSRQEIIGEMKALRDALLKNSSVPSLLKLK